MEVLPLLNLPNTHEKIEQTAVILGDLLREHPLYQTYMRSIMDLESDMQVRDLSLNIQAKQNAFNGGRGNAELADELKHLNQELEALPIIQSYHAAETDARALLNAVNTVLSETLKVDFVANAKRGCGCGG